MLVIRENMQRKKKIKQSCYWKLARLTTTWPYYLVVPIAVYACIVPVVSVLRTYEESLDNTLMFPRGTESADAYNDLLDDFGGGYFLPYEILVKSDTDTDNILLTDDTFMETVCNTTKIIYNEFKDGNEKLYNDNITSVATIPAAKSPQYPDGYACITAQDWRDYFNNDAPEELFQELWDRSVNDRNSSTILTVQANFDPFGPAAKDFIKQLRRTLHRIEDTEPHYSLYLNS
eukprot:UN23707